MILWLEKWLSNYEHLLLWQRVEVWVQASTLSGLWIRVSHLQEVWHSLLASVAPDLMSHTHI